MQKKLLTMAVAGALAAPVAAFADVTVYGTIDGGIRNVSKLHTPGGPAVDDGRMEVTNGLRTTNRLGFRGSEDLGGGLMANFTMEGQHDSDTGAREFTTARKSIVGLSKGGMSFDVGRDYTVNFKSQGIYDPMSYTYTGITPAAGTNTAGVRSSNMVTAGFRFGTGGIRVDYALGETLENSTPAPQDNDRFGIMGDFAFGPVTVTGAFSTSEADVAAIKGIDVDAPGDVETMNFGAAYRMGAFTFRAGWSNTDYDFGGGVKVEEPLLMLGVQYGFSPTLNGRVGIYDEKLETTNVPVVGTAEAERRTFIVALDYYLSKRTTLYVAFDRVTLDDNAQQVALAVAEEGTRLDGSTGVGVGIAHAF